MFLVLHFDIQVAAGTLEYCHSVLVKYTLKNASETGGETPFTTVSPELLPNLAPLFDKRVVKSDVDDIFKWRFELLAETALKLPYQVGVQ